MKYFGKTGVSIPRDKIPEKIKNNEFYVVI